MKLLEHEAKTIFRKYQIPVPDSAGPISKVQQLAGALKKLRGPWVIKAQVLVGGRGKAGGIKKAKNLAEAREIVKQMLGMTLVTHQSEGHGIKVRELLIEGQARIEKEFYFSVAIDRKLRCPLVVASAQGGMDIEEVAQKNPEAILRLPVDPWSGLKDFQARNLAFALGLPGDKVSAFVRLTKDLVRLFISEDLSLLEVNPLAVTPNGFLALDAKVITDDNALFRHKEMAEKKDPEETPVERHAKEAGISYIGLDGTIGCLVNGAGLAMATMDTIALAGGSPANFLDVGGSADEARVTKAFEIILKDEKVKAILVNIFGGIVKCDVIASGILQAVKKTKLRTPLIVRLQGTNVDEGRRILSQSKINIIGADGLWDAAQKAVGAARSAHKGS